MLIIDFSREATNAYACHLASNKVGFVDSSACDEICEDFDEEPVDAQEADVDEEDEEQESVQPA